MVPVVQVEGRGLLNLSLGERVVIDGQPHILGRPDARGHLIFGPYELLQPGRYRIRFRLSTWGESSPDPEVVCAVLDVAADQGAVTIAAASVHAGDLSGQGTRILAFELTAPAVVEYRVHAEGACSLLVADEPRAEKLDPVSATARQDEGGSNAIVELGHRLEAMESRQERRFRAIDRKLQRFVGNGRSELAREVIHAVGWRGDDQNSLYRAFVGTERPITSPPQPVPFSSTLCHQAHFALDQYRFWARALKETPRFQRKQWEFIFIAQALYERGLLAPGKRGLVFGAGEEQLPALFASFGVTVLATDQGADSAVQGGWIASGQHTHDISALNKRGICTDKMFAELVSFRAVDMNAIPADLDGQFDFCWSACALEHLGSIEHGFAFIENSLNTLRPGGVAIHTTEYNISSNVDTIETENLCLFRRCDIDAFLRRAENAGVTVEPLDWTLGEGFAETVIDLPPFSGRGEPHIRLRAGEFDTTSIALILSKPA